MRKNLFQSLHTIAFYSEGTYTFTELYGFPIYLRRFIFNELNEHYESKNKTQDVDVVEQTRKNIQTSLPKVKPQNSNNTDYATKLNKRG